jgi:hypothetical protein
MNKTDIYRRYIRISLKFLIVSFLIISGNVYSQWASNYWGSNSGDINILNARGLAVAVDNHGHSIVTGYLSNTGRRCSRGRARMRRR